MLKNKYQNHIIEGLELYKIAFLHDFIVGRKTALYRIILLDWSKLKAFSDIKIEV